MASSGGEEKGDMYFMTHNQIEYWNLQETKRHNVTTEDESKRHNVAGEGETNRHNVVTENIEIGKLGEQTRHNKATEWETNRHNVETENIGYGTLAESVRHNTATESIQAMDAQTRKDSLNEQIRHNAAQESIDRVNATTNAVDRTTRAAQSWISGSNSQSKKAIGKGIAIGPALSELTKGVKLFNPIIVPKSILQPIRPNSKGGTSA